MIIDKKISIGNIFTIFAIIGGFIWSASLLSTDTRYALKSANTALETAHDNTIRIAVVETKIEEGFNNIEKLIKELK